MESLESILELTLRELGIEKSMKRYQALWIWPKVVGDRIAEVTEPQRVSEGKLFIRVKNDTWRNELVYYKPKIIKKLNTKLGAPVIEDIIFI